VILCAKATPTEGEFFFVAKPPQKTKKMVKNRNKGHENGAQGFGFYL